MNEPSQLLRSPLYKYSTTFECEVSGAGLARRFSALSRFNSR